MKTDLSSQITLTRIPQRYYRPENAFEHSVLTRLEKIPTNIYESADEGSFAIAKEIADQIRKKQEIGENFVMAIPGGRSPLSVYKELIRMHKEEQLSFRNVVVFVEYEFFPLVSPSERCHHRFLPDVRRKHPEGRWFGLYPVRCGTCEQHYV